MNIHNILPWLEGRHGDPCASAHCQLHSVSLQLIDQSNVESDNSGPALLSGKLDANYASDFILASWIDVRAFRRATDLGFRSVDHDLVGHCTFGAEIAWVKTTCG